MISVVIPVYNGEKYIHNAYAQICSAAEQLPSHEQVEILFVNDGSVDSSAAILDKLAASDSRVQHITKENGGTASARNVGLERAAGEYICFMDQDDVMKPDMLSVLYEDMEKSGADFVQGSANVIRNGVESPDCHARSQKVITYGTELYTHYLQSLVMRGLVHYPECEVSASVRCCMFRTKFLRENNISFYRFCDNEDDWIFRILTMVYAETFVIETKTVYSWLIHRSSESSSRVEKDRYLEDFYDKHRLLRAFCREALKHASLTEKQEERMECELQKQALLWALSNETGRGIHKHTEAEIVDIMTHVVEREKYEGIYRRVNRRPLYISVAQARGVKRWYYAFRDELLTFLLLHKQIPLAVRLNHRVFHGRWHI